MADSIIDLTQYLHGGGDELPRGTFALWGADGERSRFALPLWRIIYLARGGRGLLMHRSAMARDHEPFVVLDLTQDPPRLAVDVETLPSEPFPAAPALVDRKENGLVLYLGARRGTEWLIVVDGGGDRVDLLEARAREDILFLAGECAGLLFLKDLDAL